MLVKKINFKDIFNPYLQQLDFYRAFFSEKYNRYALNVHRRFGKDACFFSLAWLVASMRNGSYLYTLPKIAQAKNLILEGTDLEGRKWIDLIPKHLISKVNLSERKIFFTSASILTITGVDNLFNSHIGSNLHGLFMSEYQRTHPQAWDYLRPILNRTGGFACFNWTSLGKNHAYQVFQQNKDNPDWYCIKLTVDDTRDNDGNYIFSPEQIEDERQSGMDEDLIEQEYYCDDSVSFKGTFFEEQLKIAESENRIQDSLQIYPNIPVNTSWDLGMRDTNSIWFFQVIGKPGAQQFHYIHHHDQNYGSIEFYVKPLHQIQSKYGFSRYGKHFMSHDVSVSEWSTGKTRMQALMQAGITPTPVPRVRVIEGVGVARSNFNRCWFSKSGCHIGLEALAASRAKYDDKLKAFTSDELHDWASHASAAFQYGHVGWLDNYNKPQLMQQREYARSRR